MSIYAIFMASLKHGAFTWSYRSSIYIVHCYGDTLRCRLYEKWEIDWENVTKTVYNIYSC